MNLIFCKFNNININKDKWKIKHIIQKFNIPSIPLQYYSNISTFPLRQVAITVIYIINLNHVMYKINQQCFLLFFNLLYKIVFDLLIHPYSHLLQEMASFMINNIIEDFNGLINDRLS